MILHRLLIEDFRGVRREEIEVPDKGVLVVEGPNESGKTSLMDAFVMLLKHKASSGRSDVKAASPVGRDVPTVIEAEFTIGGERLRYRKEFIRGKRTSLEFPGGAQVPLTGDDAHEYVRQLLDRKVDWSLWEALKIAQDEPISQVDAGKGLDALRRALDSAAGGEDPGGDDSLIAKVSEERNRYLTASRGEPTGALARSEARVTEARSELARAQERYAELDAAVAEHSEAEAAHKSRSTSLTSLESELARLEAADRAVTQLRDESRAADAEVDRAMADLESSSRRHEERSALIARRDASRDRAAELQQSAAAAETLMEPAEDRARAARTALENAEESLTRTRARLDAAREAHERQRRRSDLEAVQTLLDSLRAVAEELGERESELAEVTLDEELLDRIRAADEVLREAVIRSAASAPSVEVSGEGVVTVGDETIEAAEGWSREIVEDTAFRVGEVTLTVVPAGDTEAVRGEESAARSRLAGLLDEAGVLSSAEAEDRARRAAWLEAEIAALRRRRTDLLGGDTQEELDERRRVLEDGLAEASSGTATEPSENPEHPDQDPAEEAARTQQEVALLRAADRAAAKEAEECRTELATRRALAADAFRRAEDEEASLAEARKQSADADTSQAHERARSVADEARSLALRASQRLEEALADAPPELLENVRASLAALVAEERQSAAAVATALGTVNAIGDQGRLDAVAAAERESAAAERENAALWRRARAADLLHRTLTARRAEAMKSYQAPFHRAVVELGALVYGREFDVRLGEDLTILSRRVGQVSVDYASLSGGAREQLSVIVRIACARLVGDDGVPVFLDDTMGYTDPSRRLAMGAVIAAAASSSQLIVLTCDRARFAGIGGARTHVMGRARTEREGDPR